MAESVDADFNAGQEAAKTAELALASAYRRRRRYSHGPNAERAERDLAVWLFIREAIQEKKNRE